MTILVSRRGDESLPSHASLQGAWRGQAVPEGGLYQVSCWRRHAALQRQWRGQALPARGLPHGSSNRRHTPLHRARRGQAVPSRELHQVCSRRHGALQGAVEAGGASTRAAPSQL
jgi:hypothetical protein